MTISTRTRRTLSGKRIPPEQKRPEFWPQLVLAGPEPKESRHERKAPESISFTTAADPGPLRRRARRDVIMRDLGAEWAPTYVTEERPTDSLIQGRARRRAYDRRAARNQRKGQRAFNRRNYLAERDQANLEKLIEVAGGETSATPTQVANAAFGLQQRGMRHLLASR